MDDSGSTRHGSRGWVGRCARKTGDRRTDLEELRVDPKTGQKRGEAPFQLRQGLDRRSARRPLRYVSRAVEEMLDSEEASFEMGNRLQRRAVDAVRHDVLGALAGNIDRATRVNRFSSGRFSLVRGAGVVEVVMRSRCAEYRPTMRRRTRLNIDRECPNLEASRDWSGPLRRAWRAGLCPGARISGNVTRRGAGNSTESCSPNRRCPVRSRHRTEDGSRTAILSGRGHGRHGGTPSSRPRPSQTPTPQSAPISPIPLPRSARRNDRPPPTAADRLGSSQAMTGYSTISHGTGSGSADEMPSSSRYAERNAALGTTADSLGRRRRRARSPKGGGGNASLLSSNINLVNTSTSRRRPRPSDR